LSEAPINKEAYEKGYLTFRGLDFLIGPGAYAEIGDFNYFLDEAKKTLDKSPVILDLCCGTGMIGIALANEIPNATVYGVEKYPEPFVWTIRNSKNFEKQLSKIGSKFIPVFTSAINSVDILRELEGKVNLVISSCPTGAEEESSDLSFIPWIKETMIAPEGGLGVLKELESASLFFLKEDGAIFTTVGERSYDEVSRLFDLSIWNPINFDPDQWMSTSKCLKNTHNPL